ncbi:MAG TPA: universal stress protein, partial [Sphingobacteriaceae bacterium]
AGVGSLSRIALAADEPDERLLKALGYLAGLAAPFKAEILITHVSAPDTPDAEVNRRLEQLQEAASAPDYGKISCADVRGDDISRTLLEFSASHRCDLIAVVHQRHTLYQQVFDESVTRKVMGRHRIPCLVFPADF